MSVGLLSSENCSSSTQALNVMISQNNEELCCEFHYLIKETILLIEYVWDNVIIIKHTYVYWVCVPFYVLVKVVENSLLCLGTRLNN